MTKLRIAPGLDLPPEAATSTFAILAKRRAGKSNAAVVIAEAFYDAGVPWVAIDPKGDWWGVRSDAKGTGPGLSVVVFGGLHADVPLEPGSGAYVADLIAEHRLTCVLDVSEMTKADQVRFLLAFAERLLRVNREPLHLFLEECDEYLPQVVHGDVAKLVGAMGRLVRRGGFRGLGCTLITQRSAVVNKDVLTQVETLVVLRTTSPQDRKAIKSWVDVHADAGAVVDTLPGLETGEAWVWSPSFLGLMERVKFPRRRTFDSGTTPKMGEVRRQPTKLADVDLDAVTAAMADAIERAKADDPKLLRKRIIELDRELVKARKAALTPEPVIERVEVPVVPVELLEQLGGLRAQTEKLTDLGLELTVAVDRTLGELERCARAVPTPRAEPRPQVQRARAVAPVRPVPRPEAAPTGDVQLKAGARRILETLARHHPVRVTKAQLGTLAKFKITGGTFITYWGVLKRHGLVEQLDGLIGLTDAGMAEVGHVPAEPFTTDELLEQWRSALKAGARRMLDVLVDAYPNAIDRERLADNVEMMASGGTFQTYLGTLRRNGLIDVEGGTVRASDSLFLGS